MSTYAFTGHRPERLGGYGEPVAAKLFKLATQVLLVHQPSEVISGMALGWDQAVAFAAIRLKIPVTAAVPFLGQEAIWPELARARYQAILNKCSEVIVVSPGGYEMGKLHIRNQWMVDHCVQLIALWDGSSGGTSHCVNYATYKKVEIINVWDQWEKMNGINT